MLKINEQEFKKAVKFIVAWQRLVDSLDMIEATDHETGRQLSDLRDYMTFLCLDIMHSPAESRILVDLLEWAGEDSWASGDQLHEGFFLALDNILSLKHEIALLPGELISRQDFEKSWQLTKRELRMGGKKNKAT